MKLAFRSIASPDKGDPLFDFFAEIASSFNVASTPRLSAGRISTSEEKRNKVCTKLRK